MSKNNKILLLIQQRIDGMKNGKILTPEGNIYSEHTIYSWKGIIKWIDLFENENKRKLTLTNIKEFPIYLIKKNLAKNTVANLCANVNCVLPSGDKLKTHSEVTTAVYNSISELNQISDLKKLSKSMEIVRDMYIVQAYTGVRVSDLLKILKNINSYLKAINGKQYFILKSQKKKQDVVIPLNKIVLSILKKRKFKFEKLFTTWYYSKCIKKLGKAADFTEEIFFYQTRKGKMTEKIFMKWHLMSTHTARRSFATNAFLAGVPILMIMRITGHKTEAAFMRYIRASSLVSADAAANHAFFN